MAATAVEGADVRAAEVEAVTGVGVAVVAAEDATNNFLIIGAVLPLRVLRVLRMPSPRIQAVLLAIVCAIASSNCRSVSLV